MDNNQIASVVREFGIPVKFSGYQILIDAIEMIINKPSMAITNEVYTSLAAIHNSSPTRVERNIRYAIQEGWKVADREIKRRHFMNRSNRCPTNDEFLRTIADSLNRGMC